MRVPIPVSLMIAIVMYARARGGTQSGATRRRWWVFSVLVEMSFYCLLRPGELFKLRCKDVSMPGSLVFCQEHVVLRLLSPENKTVSRQGPIRVAPPSCRMQVARVGLHWPVSSAAHLD